MNNAREGLHEASRRRHSQVLRRLRTRVLGILEVAFKMDYNTIEKALDSYFSPRFLPPWYFHSNTSEEIANHVFVITQLLNATTEYLQQTSADGATITYFINVGRDSPGRLAKIVRENVDFDIVSFDDVKTRSGIRIVTIEKRGRSQLSTGPEEREHMERLRCEVRYYGEQRGYRHIEDFLASLPVNYLHEELNSYSVPMRIIRHCDIYEAARTREGLYVTSQDTTGERHDESERLSPREARVIVAAPNPTNDLVEAVLGRIRDARINLRRTYYDVFECGGDAPPIGILSAYVDPEVDTSALESVLLGLTWTASPNAKRIVLANLERLLRTVSATDLPREDRLAALGSLRSLAKNDEEGILMLSSLSGFFDVVDFLELDAAPDLVLALIRFEAFEEFWVKRVLAGEVRNTEGFRTRHSSIRGTAKGGLRIDDIVEFSEVSGLAFLMTWKCARSKILFGGAKGGLRLSPRDYRHHSIDFFDSVSNLGRSLFLVTGPARDVPAGDVGCGETEISHIFEGFKSALSDLAKMVYGLKQGVALFDNKAVSLRNARSILEDHFDIDLEDRRALRELFENEEYLELVAAAQITGKTNRGLAVRRGATGRGLVFAILAAVTNEFLAGRWAPQRDIDAADRELLRCAAGVCEDEIRVNGGYSAVTDHDWQRLLGKVFPALVGGKRIVIQGAGKVGGSAMTELSSLGASIVAVADGEGAVIGERGLDITELLGEAKEHGTVMGAANGVDRRIDGAAKGSAVLTMDCDILVLAALENAVTVENAPRLQARLVACGSNGPLTPTAERLLAERSITVVYDFAANAGGVIASYFEWLSNIHERRRYEAEKLRGESFDPSSLERYVMPDYAKRIHAILADPSTDGWNALLRDMIFSTINEDYRFVEQFGGTLKQAGYVNAVLRTLAAATASDAELASRAAGLPERTRGLLAEFLRHPEIHLYTDDPEGIAAALAEG